MSRDYEEAEMIPSTAVAVVPIQRSSVLLMPVMDVNTARQRLQEFQEFIQSYLSESKDGGNDGGDYGIIPGTKKKTLLKSGADKLCEVYGLYDEYVIKETIDWDRGLFDYELTCVLKSRRDDSVVGSGVGSCSSFESKYRWRDSKQKCPKCGKENIRKSRDGGWYCWMKTEGCGAQFKDGDKSITDQVIGRVENPDVIDAKNTVLKMAKKRAKIDAVIGVTRSSGIFTQDMEDLSHAPLPAKAEPAVSTEPIEIGKPKNPSSGAPVSKVKGAESNAPTAPVNAAPPPVAPKPEPSDSSDQATARAANFSRAFKDALPKARQKDAEDLRHQWLADHRFFDASGKPSAKAIPQSGFFKVRDEAAEWASKQ